MASTFVHDNSEPLKTGSSAFLVTPFRPTLSAGSKIRCNSSLAREFLLPSHEVAKDVTRGDLVTT